jgi:Eukaryotic translation initiation factor 3 subunit 7 (eIF-3)
LAAVLSSIRGDDARAKRLHDSPFYALAFPNKGNGSDILYFPFPFSPFISSACFVFLLFPFLQVLLPNSKPTDPVANAVAGTQAGEPSLAPHPYWDDDEAEEGHKPASVAYRYRRFDLPGDIKLVARTTLNAITRRRGAAPGAAPQYVSIATLNEWDAKAAGTQEWRNTVDSRSGSLIASEIKNNSHRLAKATMSALLSGADSLRLGLISRVTRTDADNHVILGVQNVQPTSFSSQVGVNMNNAWGVIRWLVETIRKHAENLREEEQPEDEYVAKFVLLRDPNKPSMYLYNVAPDAFDREDEGEGEGEGFGEVEGADGAVGAEGGWQEKPVAAAGAGGAGAEDDDEDESAGLKKPGAAPARR